MSKNMTKRSMFTRRCVIRVACGAGGVALIVVGAMIAGLFQRPFFHEREREPRTLLPFPPVWRQVTILSDTSGNRGVVDIHWNMLVVLEVRKRRAFESQRLRVLSSSEAVLYEGTEDECIVKARGNCLLLVRGNVRCEIEIPPGKAEEWYIAFGETWGRNGVSILDRIERDLSSEGRKKLEQFRQGDPH